MRRLLMVVAAGCNAVYGLDETRAVDAQLADFDNDGVLDTADNCATVANLDQLNGDSDEYGDACDNCPLAASSLTHNEDADPAGDACDVCPARADFGDDEDGDGVGDACDPALSDPTNHRAQFDGFATLSADWQSSTVPWASAQDEVAPDAQLARDDIGLQHATIVTAGLWHAEIGVRSLARWQAGDTYGIVAKSATHEARCRMYCASDTSCAGTAEHDGLAQSSYIRAPSPFVHIAMKGQNGVVTCIFDDSYMPMVSLPSTDGMSLSIIGSPRMHITYFDYIQ